MRKHQKTGKAYILEQLCAGLAVPNEEVVLTGAEPTRPEDHNTVQYITVPTSTISSEPQSTVQYCTVQCSAVQYPMKK